MGAGELTAASFPIIPPAPDIDVECSNGVDDDFDGLIDFTPPAGETADPDCSSAADNREQGDPLPECSNGFDDDGDGLIDSTPPAGETADPDCSSAADNREQGDPMPECSNGSHDDVDGLIDFTPPAGETADPTAARRQIPASRGIRCPNAPTASTTILTA